MKHLFTLFLCLASIQHMNAQSLSLFDVDASGFPAIKAKFFAFDVAGQQQRPSISELTLTENGIPRTITNVSCPSPQPPKALSSVLVLDVSGSMSGGSGSSTNMDIAKSAAKAWVNALPLGTSECAVTSFDGSNYLNQDFTTDKNKLLNAITPLRPNGGTDYNAALISPMAGGLLVSRRGKFQRVIVLLTDGQGNGTANRIIAEANNQNCIIYCISLGMQMPTILKNIARQTGGQYYENITTEKEVENVYLKILQIAIGSESCEINWISEMTCKSDNIYLELLWQKQKSYSTYSPIADAIVSLSVSPSYVSFGKPLPSSQTDTIITLTAKNADFSVTGIIRKFGSAEVMVVNTTFPFVIPKNTSKTITLRFAQSDSYLKYASFEIATDKCTAYFSANGGFAGTKPTASTLKLTSPNGGEFFVIGSDTVITWDGISPSDTVLLEYSINKGSTWQQITNKASGLKYIWKNVPSPPSVQCLMRVQQVGDNIKIAPTELTFKGHLDKVLGVTYSADGRRIVTYSNDRTVKIWDAYTGVLLQDFIKGYRYIYGFAFNLDENRIAISFMDSTYKDSTNIYDTKSGLVLQKIKNGGNFAYSLDGSRIAIVNGNINILDANNGSFLFNLIGHTGHINDIVFSPKGNRIVTASSDSTAKIWDANTGLIINTLKGHTGAIYGVAFSPDGNRIATGSGDCTTNIWDANTGMLIQSLIGHTMFVNNVCFDFDGSRIATASRDATAKIWDVNTGKLLKTFTNHKDAVTGVAFSPDGNRLATVSWDKTAKIWDIDETPLQADTSDATFSIVAPVPTSRDIDLQQCLLGISRDSLITSFIQNTGSYPFRVDSIVIKGAEASQFSIISGIPPFNIPATGSHAVEFRFTPTSIGIKTAQIFIYTQSDTLRQTITGEGIAPALRIIGDIIDFGEVEVGKQKDTLQVITIKNTGSASLTITTTRHAGPNDVDFTTLTGGGKFTLVPGDTAKLDLRFIPKDIGRTSGRLLFDYNGVGSPATVQLFGEGIIKPKITSTTDITFDSVCIGQRKILLATVKNEGRDSIQLLRSEWNTNDGNVFTTNLQPQMLAADSSVTLPIDFSPTTLGTASGEVRWIADQDTAFTTITGIGQNCASNVDTARTTIIAQDISAKAGEKVNLTLKLLKPTGMEIVGAPTDWQARIHYNKSILFNEQTSNVCTGTTDSCVLELTGVYNPKSEELISIPCITTLGNTDHSTIVIDTFFWKNSAIVTEVATQNGTITLNGVCDDGGVRLFIPAKNSTSLSTRPNPAQDNLQIQYGLREPLTVTLELLTMTGQVAQTILSNQSQAAGQYTLTSDLSVLGNGVYLLRMRTNKEMLTTRVDVVK